MSIKDIIEDAIPTDTKLTVIVDGKTYEVVDAYENIAMCTVELEVKS